MEFHIDQDQYREAVIFRDLIKKSMDSRSVGTSWCPLGSKLLRSLRQRFRPTDDGTQDP